MMSTSVLVAYATRSGSTKEVAEAIAAELQADGLAVDLKRLPIRDGPAGYDAVVLGAPLYMFRWHKDALRFLKRNRKAVEHLPVAVFALGPVSDAEKDWVEVRAQLEKALASFPWFTPTDVKIFGGRYDPATLTFPYTLIPAKNSLPIGDLRDWETIRAWAHGLGAIFKAAGADS
jgi:menaquinone-dependent protoporphyrinogen oxidase